MSRLTRTVFFAAILLSVPLALMAQSISLPLEFRQNDIPYNYRAQRGMPISTNVNPAIGSDGRMTNYNESTSSPFPGGLFPTNNQFRAFISFGGVPGLTNGAWQNVSNRVYAAQQVSANPSNGAVAEAMGLPVGTSNNLAGGPVAIFLRRGQIGAPYLSRRVSFPFGTVVEVPATDENGGSLTNLAATAYWLAEPYTVTGHTNSGYYWSPHAAKVYAIQAGPLQVTWKKAAYTNAMPADYALTTNVVNNVTNITANYFVSAGNYYRLYTANYVVSGNPVKPPRTIYWTEKAFRNLGKPVAVPSARVGAVSIAYNNTFPRTVANQYVSPGESNPGDGTTNQVLLELRTLWYDSVQGTILAYNQEGRVFLELLGDPRPDGQTRVPLGFEIVDVVKNPTPLDTASDLGEIIPPPAPGTLESVSAEPVLQVGGQTFAYQQFEPGSGRLTLYATRETVNLNDYLVHWMETSPVAGLKWPKLLGRYQLRWPDDPSKYSHYVRPLAATETEAKATAVPLLSANAPTIEYQDALDKPRGKLTEVPAYFTWLDREHPIHRGLLRLNSGDQVAFERIFSWLDGALKFGNFADTVATNLNAWNPTNQSMQFPNALVAPRVVSQTVDVGQRLAAPAGELGGPGSSGFLAGHVHLAAGTLFNPHAYVDPFLRGFQAANLGAIIPINAIPGTNQLEVWWFRTNTASSGFNAANTVLGFPPIYWPSVIGRYTIQWPSSPREIVLAGNQGSGTLDAWEASGIIYHQNDPAAPGYNPNEEHAIMDGGRAYATRDDLNLTNTAAYSSAPFVLVEFTATDGRPAMSGFRVLREKPEAGWVFDYVVPAGRLLQPPMPLPKLAKPVEGSGETAVNYNLEPTGGAGDLPGNWAAASGANGPFSHYLRFTYQDRKNDFWVYRGLHSGLPVLQAGAYNLATRVFTPITGVTGVVGSAFELNVHASRQDEFLGLTVVNAPAWLATSGLRLSGTPGAADLGTNTIQIIVRDLYDQSTVTNTVVLQVRGSGPTVGQSPLVVFSTNSFTGSVIGYSNRPPFLATSPSPSNSFTMRYYYKTEPSFAWPGLSSPPPAGSIVPYLRAVTGGTNYVGNGSTKADPALDIVYRPFWPERDPSDSARPLATIPYGLTLVKPQLGLPGIGDWKTARVLYQQSIATNLLATNSSVVLHDPTREKIADLASFGLDQLPASIAAQNYQGRVYFPALPPHLVKRLFFDPARGAKGSLVLAGEFKDETVGEDYLLLNLLRGSDRQAAINLCPPGDALNAPKWANVVNALATSLETFGLDALGTQYIVKSAAAIGVGDLAEVSDDNVAVDSYALSASGPGGGFVTLIEAGGNGKFTQPGDPVAVHVLRVGGSLWAGQVKPILADNPLSEQVSFQHTPDVAGRFDEFDYEWKIAAPVDGLPPTPDATMSRYFALTSGTNQPRYTLGGAGIQVLGDNYVVLRYRPVNATHPFYNQWSDWTSPQLAEGWIKRVLAGLNPFNQRTKDLFNNAVVTDASILTSAGRRWEGDVALNLDTINNYGLIEIYETVLRRGRAISIESGYNDGPANDALLLAAGYLNDLYMMVGNEAWSDAANPTIGIGTANNTYADIATALFSFKGQMPSLLEEELALLRGRDDFLQPGVTLAPFYNRLVWNYTRGIDAGEVVYALNYNIKEDPNRTPDGVINAEDAAILFPQGHGDAYGHYLTALKGYYSLLLNPNFDWVPRIEAVSVLGVPVSVDYQDERKFAAAAAAVGRAGRQIFDLTWRRDYQPGHDNGWAHFSSSRTNANRTATNTSGQPVHPVRYWGLDHSATRSGQGSFLNWVVGNAILPAVDPNPNHEGIQKIDRTTVPELNELSNLGGDLQTALDNAEGGLTPLGLPAESLAMDINPNVVVGADNGTHFEQIYGRAKATLNNAVAAFDDAKDVTRLMRSEQDSLAGVQAAVARQELSYKNALIELYGTPYTDDIGPGKPFSQGYDGPDLLHYMYVETPEKTFGNNFSFTSQTYQVDVQQLPADWQKKFYEDFNFYQISASQDYKTNIIEYNIGEFGMFSKPQAWTGRRVSPGKIQQGISTFIAEQNKLRSALEDAKQAQLDLEKAAYVFGETTSAWSEIQEANNSIADTIQTINKINAGINVANRIFEEAAAVADLVKDSSAESVPKFFVAGTASGGDLTFSVRGGIYLGAAIARSVFAATAIAGYSAAAYAALDRQEELNKLTQFINDKQSDLTVKNAVVQLGNRVAAYKGLLVAINERARSLADADSAYRALIAQGDRLQAERQVARQRTSALVQGYRTRDAGFRIFRNEKLERYKTLFDLSARYAFLAANAYDYETGLLDTPAGRNFINRIVSTRALGVVRGGEPQYAGSNLGDPGLSSTLAEMKADWDVVKTRLGFNNPDAYGTTVSLRTENFRILPGTNSDSAWKDLLHRSRSRDLLEDVDVQRHCLQVSRGSGLPVPGIIIEFSTTIANGYNLFGQQLAAGDHSFSPSSFATKIFGVGAALEGYRGMDQPAANGNLGGVTPPDPNLWFLDPLALAATPYVYLIPVGVDSMRSPPLGDADGIRTWSVDDVAIPLPFNIGADQLSNGGRYQTADSLSEPLFAVRKHQAFRPVPSGSFFSTSLYGASGTLQRTPYTNNRLIGRSVWNSRWKLVIPGHTLLNDPDEGLERFMQTVRDVKLHFVTYSYSGN